MCRQMMIREQIKLIHLCLKLRRQRMRTRITQMIGKAHRAHTNYIVILRVELIHRAITKTMMLMLLTRISKKIVSLVTGRVMMGQMLAAITSTHQPRANQGVELLLMTKFHLKCTKLCTKLLNMQLNRRLTAPHLMTITGKKVLKCRTYNQLIIVG